MISLPEQHPQIDLINTGDRSKPKRSFRQALREFSREASGGRLWVLDQNMFGA